MSEPIVLQVTEQGPPGLSAYQIAVANGFVGTEAQWLASLHGQDGSGATNNILYGNGNPTNGVGSNGNFYINTATNYIFGPKSAGVWPSGTSLVGPQGTQGPDGTQGIPGADGRTILNGSGVPDNAAGNNGDFYIRTSDWTIYGPKAAGTWGAATSLVGAQGPAGNDGSPGANGADGADGRTILSGTAAPSNGTGNDGDFYINTATNVVYGPKAAGSWPAGVSLVGPAGNDGAPGADGADGADGKTILYGTAAPTTEGVDGDFYIRTSTNFIYGPKAAGSWPAGTSLIGPAGSNGTNGSNGANGKTILYGTAAPTTEGVDGDFYIRTSTNFIYGPKAAGSWPAGTSLIGPSGGAEITSAAPATPSVGTVSLARVKRASREAVGFINSLGRIHELARSFARARVGFMNCGLGALHGFGVNVATSTGTQSFPTPASTNILTRARRALYTSAATSSAGAGWNDNTSHMFLVSGFHATFVFGFSDAAPVADSRSFVGFKSATTAMGGSNPSTFTDMFGFGHDSGDTALQFMHNDNTGTATKIPLTGIDPNSTDTLYQATVHMEPGESELFYQIIDLNSGTTVEGSVTTDLPTGTTSVKPFMHRGNGTTTLAVQINVLAYLFEGEYA